MSKIYATMIEEGGNKYLLINKNNEVTYKVSIDFKEENNIIIKVIKDNEELFQKDISSLPPYNELGLKRRVPCYDGVKVEIEDEEINSRLNFLLGDTVINTFIDLMRPTEEIPDEIGGVYSNKFENPEKCLLYSLSNFDRERYNSKRRIIHTKTVIEILRDVGFVPFQDMPLDGRLFNSIEKIADKDFEIIEDIREMEQDFYNRELVENRERAEFYKVKDSEGKEMEISAFMVYTIREE